MDSVHTDLDPVPYLLPFSIARSMGQAPDGKREVEISRRPLRGG